MCRHRRCQTERSMHARERERGGEREGRISKHRQFSKTYCNLQCCRFPDFACTMIIGRSVIPRLTSTRQSAALQSALVHLAPMARPLLMARHSGALVGHSDRIRFCIPENGKTSMIMQNASSSRATKCPGRSGAALQFEAPPTGTPNLMVEQDHRLVLVARGHGQLDWDLGANTLPTCGFSSSSGPAGGAPSLVAAAREASSCGRQAAVASRREMPVRPATAPGWTLSLATSFSTCPPELPTLRTTALSLAS